MLPDARTLAWLLIPALSVAPIAERPAAAQDDFEDPMDDEFIESDDPSQAGGRERWTWPRVARIDPERQTVTLEWSPETGTAVEVIAFDDVLRLERARAYGDRPDEMFMRLADGRRVLISQGQDVPTHAILTPSMADLPVTELSPGAGHFETKGASGPDTRFIIGPGQGLEIRAVALQDMTATVEVRSKYKAVQYDDSETLEGEGGGELERQDIERVIKQRMGLIRRCYTRELRRDSSLEGTVKTRFVVDRDGTVKQATIRSSELGNPIVEACITEELSKLRFPAPRGDGTVVVNYPFTFRGG